MKALFWKLVDAIEEIFWIVLDSWRKPTDEFFVRLSKEECIRALKDANDSEPELHQLDKPLLGFFSGNHFQIQKQNRFPFFRGRGIHLVLLGKFSSTPHGTYIRLWHRFVAIDIFFLSVWFSVVFTLLFFYLISNTTVAWVVISLFYMSSLLAFIHVGSCFGKIYNFDLVKFIRDVLDAYHPSRRFIGFRLSRKMQSKS